MLTLEDLRELWEIVYDHNTELAKRLQTEINERSEMKDVLLNWVEFGWSGKQPEKSA